MISLCMWFLLCSVLYASSLFSASCALASHATVTRRSSKRLRNPGHSKASDNVECQLSIPRVARLSFVFVNYILLHFFLLSYFFFSFLYSLPFSFPLFSVAFLYSIFVLGFPVLLFPFLVHSSFFHLLFYCWPRRVPFPLFQ